jgi:glutamate racemase
MTCDGIDIALLDWGIGGLGVYRELASRDPGRRILYISDAGMTPYGAMAPPELAARILSIASWLSDQGILRLVIACNAASTLLPAIERRLDRVGVAATGVIEHGIALALSSNVKRVAVIGGGRTIRSGAHVRALRRAGIDARGRIAQPLSAQVEAGDLASETTQSLVHRALAPIRSYDGLLLACTHYPVLRDHFARVMPHATILDPAAATAEAVVGSWTSNGARSGDDLFITTGDPEQMRRSAMLAFGVDVRPHAVTNRFVAHHDSLFTHS